jgi:site-specific DNA recombinase
MTAAAIYARVSSARQAKDQTIGSQLAALRDHAAQSRLEVPEEWIFADEGHSGATLVRPGLEALRDLAAQGCLDVVLVYSPDRLARKFAYQALLIEELARCGTRVEFVKGPRGDTPEDQLLIQFQGMFAEYEKAQLMERYRRGKAWRAKAGSVNVLSGAPFGYRYVRKTPETGARYEVVEYEAALVREMFRRYADESAAIADLGRWLTAEGVRTRTGKDRWDRSVIWGMLRNPAYAGTAVFGKTQAVHEPAGLNRTARLAGRTVPRQVRVADRPKEEWTGPRRGGDVRPRPAAAGRQQAVRGPQYQGPVPAPRAGRLLLLRLRLLPHPHHDQLREEDLLLPLPRLRRLPLPGRTRLRQQARPRRLRRPGRLGPHRRPARRPRPDPSRNR